MSTASRRAKDRRSLRLEFLEDRKLLSTATPHGIAAEVAKTKTITSFSGHIQGGPASSGLYMTTSPGYHSFSGVGSSRAVGNLLFSAQEMINISGSTASITNGRALFTTYKGDNLFVSFTGTGTIATHRPTRFTLTGTVTGGNGRFHDETGTFAATGTLIPANDKLALAFTITLSRPA